MSLKDIDTGIAGQEWSYFVNSEDIDSKALDLEISAPKEARSALCKRLNLYAVNELKASIRLQRDSISKVIHVKGTLFADVLQKCIITTEPVKEIVDEKFEAWFADSNNAVSFVKAKRERMSKKERDNLPMMEEKDDPEEITDGKIDLGELVVQYLSLSLSPYPRLKGAKYQGGDAQLLDEAPSGTYDNPFAALKEWKEQESKKEK